MKIQKPTKGRVVEHTCGFPERFVVGLHNIRVGVIVNTPIPEDGIVDIRCLTSLDVFKGVQHQGGLVHGNRWRYPPFVKEDVEVKE